MTLLEILAEVNKQRPISRRQLLRHIKKAGVKPMGAKQRPQRYPINSAAVMLEYLGFNGSHRLPSIDQLRAERARARKAA